MRFKVGQLVRVAVRGGCPHCHTKGHRAFFVLGQGEQRAPCKPCEASGLVDKSVAGTVTGRESRHGDVLYHVAVPVGPGHTHPGARAHTRVEADKLVAL